MGRIYTYFCDNCKKDFKKKDHINIKANQSILFVSRFNETMKMWGSKAINFGCQEYHFCDVKCLCEYIKPRIEEAMKDKKEKKVGEHKSRQETYMKVFSISLF